MWQSEGSRGPADRQAMRCEPERRSAVETIGESGPSSIANPIRRIARPPIFGSDTTGLAPSKA